MPFFKKNTTHLTGSNVHIKYVFEPRPSLSELIVNSRSKSRPILPFKMRGYDFSIECGLRLKPPFLSRCLNSRVMTMCSLFAMWPFLWWITTSNASPQPKLYRLQSPVVTVPAAKPPLVPKIVPSSWLHLNVKPGDNLSLIFDTHQLNKTHLHQIFELGEYTKQLRQLPIGHKLHIKHNEGNIEDFILVLNKREGLHLYRENDKFDGDIQPVAGMHTETVATHGKVDTLLSVAAQEAGLSKKQLDQLSQIFQWEINDVQPGDQFSVIFERTVFKGDYEPGDILAAEFVNQGQVYRAVRYTDPVGATAYYTPKGFHLQKISILNAPLEFIRISSPFGERRHPISGIYRFHDGIDYAALWGTPIVAARNATVKFVGRRGGYGKVIILEHHKRIHTLYAHLSRYAEGLRVGDTLVQGQIIGYVGQSGQATGPHLHYEIQLDGVAINPKLAEHPITLPIAKEHKAHFFGHIQNLVTQLDVASQQTKLVQLVPHM